MCWFAQIGGESSFDHLFSPGGKNDYLLSSPRSEEKNIFFSPVQWEKTIISLGEILHCVVVTNVLYDLADELNVVGIFALFDKSAEHIAENASEILVASVR